MNRDEPLEAANPQALADYVTRSTEALQAARAGHGGHMPMESVREATYRGHHVVIRTTYHIEVDGKLIEGHVGVTDDGQVHYHAMPNLGFDSAVDMVKRLIDAFPEDFPPGAETASRAGARSPSAAARGDEPRQRGRRGKTQQGSAGAYRPRVARPRGAQGTRGTREATGRRS